MPRKKRTESEWKDIIAEFERGKLEQSAFAKANGLTLSSLRAWLYRIRKSPMTPQFIEVQGSQSRPEKNPTVVVYGKARIEFGELPSADYLSSLLREIGHQP